MWRTRNMGINLHYNTLNKNRFALSKNLLNFKGRFYLGGGTGLALQIGHRVSEDFDFFTNVEFDNEKLLFELKNVLHGYQISILQNEENTLTCLVNNEIKLSFFNLNYKNFCDLIKTEYFDIASVLEIGIMKLLALTRASYKDYVDLFYIFKKHKISEVLSTAKKKHTDFNESIYLKCLLSYEDINMLPINFVNGYEVDSNLVFNFIESEVKSYIGAIRGL